MIIDTGQDCPLAKTSEPLIAMSLFRYSTLYSPMELPVIK